MIWGVRREGLVPQREEARATSSSPIHLGSSSDARDMRAEAIRVIRSIRLIAVPAVAELYRGRCLRAAGSPTLAVT